MKYYARFSEIRSSYGFMGIRDVEFDVETIEELEQEIKKFYDKNETKSITYLLDELEDEEGNEVEIKKEVRYYDKTRRVAK